jgi:hypothetical protein
MRLSTADARNDRVDIGECAASRDAADGPCLGVRNDLVLRVRKGEGDDLCFGDGFRDGSNGREAVCGGRVHQHDVRVEVCDGRESRRGARRSADYFDPFPPAERFGQPLTVQRDVGDDDDPDHAYPFHWCSKGLLTAFTANSSLARR